VLVVSHEVGGNVDLALVDVSSGSVVGRLTSRPDQDRLPALSPDRGTVIYIEQTGTTRVPRVVAANGAGDRALAEAAPPGCDRVNRIAWNPVQAAELAVVCLDKAGKYSLQIIGVDGAPIRTLETGLQRVDDVTYSPDGNSLAFWGSDPSSFDGGSIFTMAADGQSAPVPLSSQPAGTDADPAFSPDGSQIAFRRRLPGSTPQGNLEIFVMDADGSEARQLTDDPANDQEPSWSPDGSRIAFTSGRTVAGGTAVLWQMAADGSDQQQILSSGDASGMSGPAWSRR
jgi:Tol biopolymer transport system component